MNYYRYFWPSTSFCGIGNMIRKMMASNKNDVSILFVLRITGCLVFRSGQGRKRRKHDIETIKCLIKLISKDLNLHHIYVIGLLFKCAVQTILCFSIGHSHTNTYFGCFELKKFPHAATWQKMVHYEIVPSKTIQHWHFVWCLSGTVHVQFSIWY